MASTHCLLGITDVQTPIAALSSELLRYTVTGKALRNAVKQVNNYMQANPERLHTTGGPGKSLMPAASCHKSGTGAGGVTHATGIEASR